MTDVYAPPPPPPPPPPAPAAPAFDFIRPFAFVFQDPRWLPKILIGGLFFLLSFILIGVFFVFGYVARLVRNVIAGMQSPLPEWDDLGEYFSEGLRLFCVMLVYAIPIIVGAILIGIPGAIMSAAEHESVRDLGGGILGCAWCLMVPISFAIMFFLPAGLLMTITTGRFGAAFEFANLWSFIRDNIGNYLLAIVIYLVARFLSGFGVILLCIGVIFTEFWALLVSGYAFAQMYRMARRQ